MTLNSKNHERKVQRKQKRLQQIVANDSGAEFCDVPTQVNLEKSSNLTGISEIYRQFYGNLCRIWRYVMLDYQRDLINSLLYRSL